MSLSYVSRCILGRGISLSISNKHRTLVTLASIRRAAPLPLPRVAPASSLSQRLHPAAPAPAPTRQPHVLQWSRSFAVKKKPSVEELEKRVLEVTLKTSGIEASKVQVSRSYSAQPPLTLDFIQSRVMLVLKLFDKVDPNKLTVDSHFINDLGLDSLDQVEIIMAIEDEFGFEIPDTDADRLTRPRDIVRYVADREDIYD